jgi:flagellar protein FliO/FliZ
MFDNLLGMELPLVVKFVVAFVVVLALIAGTFWLIRRLGASRVGGGQAKGRQPRLAVIDAAALDSRRRLVLIRRDNVEHLVMIGGPADLVIEPNIVRAVPVGPPREAPPPRGPGETAPRGPDMVRPEPSRPAPPPDQGWTPPPLPEGIRPRAEAPVRNESAMAAQAPEPRRPPRPPPDLPPVEVRQSPPTADVNLADMAQRLEAALRRPAGAAEPRSEPRPEPRPAPMPRPMPPRAAPPFEAAPMPRSTPRPAAPPPMPPPEPAPPAAAAEPPREASQAAPPPAAQDHAAPEAPHAAAEPPPAEAPHAQAPEPAAAEPPKGEAAPPKLAQPKTVFDSLEEEMASLLGKPEKT